MNMFFPLGSKDLQIISLLLLLPALLKAQDRFPTDTMDAHSRGADRSEVVVPTVVHIIHYHGVENISDAQVHDALRILNEDFNKQNPEWPSVHPQFIDLVADVGIEFRLAKLDPEGNCTNGITRTVSPLTFAGYQPMRDLIQWPPERYMNVWVHAYQPGVVIGIPLPPDLPVLPAEAELTPAADGVMMENYALGSIGTSQPIFSHVFTHRVGHWLNLLHPWGNMGQPLGSNTLCDQDDEVADTPLTHGSFLCNTGQTTCGSLDNVENFMEYSHCSKMFTHGQKERMLTALNSPVAQRNNLITSENHALTGMDIPGSPCLVNLISDQQQICVGGSITFTDVSYHGITQRWWNFPGGSPASSTELSPVITYEQPGIYDVELTVTDGVDTLSTHFTAYIEVLPLPGSPIPIMEGFEDHDNIATHPWSLFDPDQDGGWEITSVASASGQQSVWLSNSPEQYGRTDELISGPFDMTGIAQMNMSFRYAYARRSTTDQDALKVYTSNDCGNSWQLRSDLNAFQLNTGGIMDSDFIPTSDEWGYREINNIIYPEFSDAVRIKFKFEQKGGNHIYLDDINIHGSSVGLDEIAATPKQLQLIPNPAQGDAELLIELGTTEKIGLEIYDAVGRLYHQQTMQLLAGQHRIALPVAMLRSGAYVVKIQQHGKVESLRLIIQ